MNIRYGFNAGDAILITGAASGIGRATAIAAAQQELNVAAWDLNGELLSGVEEEIRSFGVHVHSEVADVGIDDEVRAAMKHSVEALGKIRMLHNNAAPPSSVPLEFNEAVRISVGSVRSVTEAWSEHRPDSDSSMVVTSSIAGNIIGTDSDWYSSSKAALAGYVRHLAAYRSGEFRSNAVAPGMTLTPRIAPFAESETGKRALERIPLKRMATAGDIAQAVLFLLSPSASYINGVFLPVDGGWTVTQ